MTILEEATAIALERPLSKEELGDLTTVMELNRESRLRLDRDSDRLKASEVAINALIVDQLRRHTGPFTYQTTTHEFSLSSRIDEPSVSSWEDLWTHIYETRNFSLLEKRVLKTAIKEIWAAGEAVPGVEKYPTYKLVKTKI